MTKVEVGPRMLRWAIERSGREPIPRESGTGEHRCHVCAFRIIDRR